jgi:sulfur-oxidizing protein SoxY
MRRYRESRRQVLRGAGACLIIGALPRSAGAAGALPAIPELDGWLAGRVPRIERVTLELPRFADNADAVPMNLKVAGPFSDGESVLGLRLFSEKNPYPRMAEFHLMPGLSRVELETRVRLAESQIVVAIAELEHGELLAATAEVTVTASACIDGG